MLAEELVASMALHSPDFPFTVLISLTFLLQPPLISSLNVNNNLELSTKPPFFTFSLNSIPMVLIIARIL
jgi:hypothetical protein